MSQYALAPVGRLFKDLRRTSWAVVALFVVLHSVLLFIFFTDAFIASVTAPVARETQGLLTHTLLTNMIELVVMVGGVMLLVGRLRLRDLGLTFGHALNGFIVGMWLWAVAQALTVFVGLAQGELTLTPSLAEITAPATVGKPLEATLGSGLIEEIEYRGFLLPQLFLLLGHYPRLNVPQRLMIALVISQLFFGINHIPAGLSMGMEAPALVAYIVQVFLTGLFFAAFYLRTGNLLVAVVVHALLNQPLAMFHADVDPAFIILICSCLLLLAWPTLARIYHEVFTLREAMRER